MNILNSDQPPMQEDKQSVKTDKGAQDAYDKFVINGLEILHNPETTDSIIKQVETNPDTIEGIGEAALNIVNRLEEGAYENKFDFTANTVLNGLNVFVGEVISIIEATGEPPIEDEQKFQAFSWAMSNYISNAVRLGKVSKEELSQLSQELGQTDEGKQIAQQMGRGAEQERMLQTGGV